MTRGERILRVGELLAKGVALMLRRQAEDQQILDPKLSANTLQPSLDQTDPSCSEDCTSVSDGTERAIIGYLKRVGNASPRDIQSGLGLPKSTAFRKLNSLVRANKVSRFDSTTATRYRLIQTET